MFKELTKPSDYDTSNNFSKCGFYDYENGDSYNWVACAITGLLQGKNDTWESTFTKEELIDYVGRTNYIRDWDIGIALNDFSEYGPRLDEVEGGYKVTDKFVKCADKSKKILLNEQPNLKQGEPAQSVKISADTMAQKL